jgi:hypothetical protein
MVDTPLCVPSKACIGLFDDGDRLTGICTMNTVVKEWPYSALREKSLPVAVFAVLEYFATLMGSSFPTFHYSL